MPPQQLLIPRYAQAYLPYPSHPEHVALHQNLVTYLGPSPRVRGAAGRRAKPRRGGGSIPARAGSRLTRLSGFRSGGVHPRACGEQCAQGKCGIGAQGPSPRVRGAATPSGWTTSWPGVHPRACGEQVRGSDTTAVFWGPSPRVRGAALPRRTGPLPPGSIPARAGSRTTRSPTPRIPRVHPRACGEQRFADIVRGLHVGPSPRVRGAECGFDAGEAACGSIPARAGSRLGRSR